MKTTFAKTFLESDIGRRADKVIRSCVHCGFCNATCPTYQLTGDELDGPRGRIYLIKEMLEGNTPGYKTMQHLDRCLNCRNCETTCPSGVQYSELLDIGRQLVETEVSRPREQKLFRALLRRSLLSPLFNHALQTARVFRPLLPEKLKRSIPIKNTVPKHLGIPHTQKVLLVEGCVQKSIQPSIDTAAINFFDHLGLETIRVQSAGCCGAINHHLSDEPSALTQIKRNIDIWYPLLKSGSVEAITMTASGCGLMIRDYARILQDDSEYAKKAEAVSEAFLDPIDFIETFNDSRIMSALNRSRTSQRIAFHPPCTLQHGLKITGKIESLLHQLGHEVVKFSEPHLCCGSAGTYSITQPEFAERLKQRKIDHIEAQRPDMIVTANIGCQTHLQSGTDIPVKHWLEVVF